MSLSYGKISAETKEHHSVTIRFEGKDLVLKEGTHYRLYF